MTDCESLVQELLDCSTEEQETQFLQDHHADFSEACARALKNEALGAMRADTQQALRIVNLLYALSNASQDPIHRGYGAWAEAVVRSLSLGEYRVARKHYQEALAIFGDQGDELSQATIQISHIYTLAMLGRHDEAFTAGEWAHSVLEAHETWLPLATLNMNLGIILDRLGKGEAALAHYDRAKEAYESLGVEGQLWWAQAEHNRSVTLRTLGRFQEALDAGKRALRAQERLQNRVEMARAQQNLGVTQYVMGRYNDALALLNLASSIFQAEDLKRHAIRAELYVVDCLLRLRRFDDVLAKCQLIRQFFADLGSSLEEGQAAVQEAIALAGLGRREEALALLDEAIRLFAREDYSTALTLAELEKARVLIQMERFDEALLLAADCAAICADGALPVGEAEACLVAAQAALMTSQPTAALAWQRGAAVIAEAHNIVTLTHKIQHLSGVLACARGEDAAAFESFRQAIEAVELLRWQMMVEFRSSFQEDKQVLYEDMVALCLDLERTEDALDYTERAKSRALVDLLAYRPELGIRVHDERDRPLVEELTRLQQARGQLYRRQEGDEELREQGWRSATTDPQAVQEVHDVENKIRELWHQLLIRRESYAQEASLWQVVTEPVQPHLAENTLLIEYFLIRGHFIAFLVTGDTIRVQRLTAGEREVKRLLDQLYRNFRAAGRSRAARLPDLTQQAQTILQKLHALLIAPFSSALAPDSHLLIVPHALLHYLPFHAFYDGERYLLEAHEISYLPNASLLRHCQNMRPGGEGVAAFGHAHGGQLPFAPQEAQQVAALLGGEAIVDRDATVQRLRQIGSACRLLHLATHAEFRQDAPLFSGLAFEDGWLTTMDIFTLDLKAELVTMSACQTGRHVLGGGDELLGLMRALFYAGASSLLLSLWPVEDHSTAMLMVDFYRALTERASKRAALRAAQHRFIQAARGGDPELSAYAHPFFWAPFFLVGNTDALAPAGA